MIAFPIESCENEENLNLCKMRNKYTIALQNNSQHKKKLIEKR